MVRRQQRADRVRCVPSLGTGASDVGAFDPSDRAHEPGQLALLADFHEQVAVLPVDERRVLELLY